MNDVKLITNDIIIEPEQDDRKYKKIILIILGAFFLVFVVWGGFAKLSSAVGAPGKITVALNNRIIQHLEGGIVKKIYVKDGDYVNAGQILVKLDDTKSASDLSSIEANYYEQLAVMDRLLAEKNDSKAIKFDNELLSGSNMELKQTLTNSQKNEFRIRMSELNGQLSILGERMHQMERQSEGVSSEIEAKKALSDSYAKQVVDLQKLFDERLIDKQKLTDETRQKIATDGNIASLTADKAKIGAQIAEVKAQIYDVRQNFQKQVAAQLSEAETKVADYKSRVTSIRDSVSRTEIKAPVAGYIVGLSVNTIGGVIPPGRQILSIVPKGEPLIAECRVSPSDIYYVQPGSKVKLSLPSFAHVKTLKDVDGVVSEIASDITEDPQARISYYKVIVKLDSSGEKELASNNLKLVPGMPVEAMIITGDRTFIDYLIKPFETMLRKGMREQ